MTLETSHHAPTSKERKALAIALCALAVVIALVILLRPESLLVIACITTIAWCMSMLFNKDEPHARQWKGVFVPLVVGLAYAAVRFGESPRPVAVTIAVALAALGIVVWLREGFGSRFYETWRQLFLPVAWSVSTLLLILVYYVVITPIGILLRMAGRDPLHRKFDPDRASYWESREPTVDPERYFRQF